MKYATGIDHLIYGWLFFGVVMLILFWIGSLWREDIAPRDPTPRFVAPAQRTMPSLGTVMAATIAAAMTVACWPFAASRFEDTGPSPPLVLQTPPPAGGWQPLAGRLTDWTPRFLNPQGRLKQAYEKDASRAEVFIGYYRQQRQGAQLISSQNMLVASSDRVWRNVGEMRRTLDLGREQLSSIEARLRGQSGQLLVWSWYWVDGQYVVNPYWAKLLQAKSTFFGRGDDGAVVIVYAPFLEQPAAADKVLRDFVSAMLPAITTSLEHARRARP